MTVRHYRSIKELVLKPSPLCGLIGPNNAGKTNILRALEVILGERWPTSRTFSETDYHQRDLTKPIEIDVEFVPKSTPDNLAGVSLKAPADDKVEYNVTYRSGGKPSFVSWKTKEQFALVYVAAGRDLAKQLTVSSWTLLGRLMQMADSDLKGDPSLVKSLEDKLDAASEVLKTPKFKEIEQSLKTHTTEHLGKLPYSLELDFDIYNPINYYRSVQLLATEGGKTYDATDLGSGLQNAIVLGLFRTYAKLWTETVAIAIEEPELFLHPHAQRAFYRLMKKLTTTGSQVLYTTHSPHFVDVRDYESIALVRRTADLGSTVRQCGHLKDLDSGEKEFQAHAQFDPERSEMFFAEKVILVEGDCERVALKHVARIQGVDLDDVGVTIVECGNKHGITVFTPILNAFQFPYLVAHDKDPGDSRREKESLEIEALCPDATRRFVFDPDFEGVLGLAKHLRPFEVHKLFDSKRPEDLPQVLKNIIARSITL